MPAKAFRMYATKSRAGHWRATFASTQYPDIREGGRHGWGTPDRARNEAIREGALIRLSDRVAIRSSLLSVK